MSSPIDSLTYQAPAHVFNPLHAAAYGIEEAILIAHFHHWLNNHKSFGCNGNGGSTSKYMTIKEMTAQVPYMTETQVRRFIYSLKSQGIVSKCPIPGPGATHRYTLNESSIVGKGGVS